ncbi:hypothetical protein D8674_004218 [Pyrus ussuriensis x Pyrus communis]|uniref:Uncharacterized protein n=1 Tax=Pyrus ussuriensis x Pyrus communis TaxID=2448454 RepID=A0A5N5FJW2_9ROSA|nr:hypothetical protein D8674_004218 [Pyrus ussuriensis x Pyrus communis]
MNLASKICMGRPLFILQHRASAITWRDLNDLISESHSCGAAAYLIGTSRGGLDHPEEIHGIDGSGTEHLDLIGASRDGLDHPEEIYGIDDNDMEWHRRTCWAWKSQHGRCWW